MSAPDAVADEVLLGAPSVAVRGGRILAVGSREEILARCGPGTTVRDHGEATQLPGFRDSHAHFVPTGLARRRLDLTGRTLGEVREAVAERAASRPGGEPIGGAGFSLSTLGTATPPGAADLDDVAPHHPVRLASHDLHALWVNTAALARAGRPPGSASYLTEDEVRLFNDAFGRETPEELLAAARAARDAFLAAGIVEVQDHGRLDELEALCALAAAGELRLRVRFSVRGHELRRYLAERDRFPEFPDFLTVNGQKLFLDGALGSRTAWTLEPWRDGPGTGHRAMDHEAALAAVKRAADAGLPTFFHAIGDAAVREALDLCAAAPGLPHRVEHAQLIHPGDLPRFAAQGVTASLQPVHLLTDTPILLRAWGEERARRSFPCRSLLESGARLLLGSDTPVETFSPMAGVFAASRRRTREGLVLPGEERIPRETALALYLARPALVPGDPACVTTWPIDPRTAPPAALPPLTPLAVKHR